MKYSLQIEDLHIEGFEQVLKISCESVQLVAVIAIHQTKVGPALGGIRAFNYSQFDDGLQDALRLSKAMTYKALLSSTGTGGGKSVIFLPEGLSSPTEGMLRAFGQAVDSLQGKYIAAEDVGISVQDMTIIHEETPYVCGLASISGDPSIYTAHGVFLCIQETVDYLWNEGIKGKRVAVQGLGSVGRKLVHELFFAGADLIVYDTRKHLLDEVVTLYGAQVDENIISVDCDVLCPCALGGVINACSVDQLRCRAIVGAANNQLENTSIGKELAIREILYAPDYLANAGGLLNVASSVGQTYAPKEVLKKVESLPKTLRRLYEKSIQESIDTGTLANTIVEERLAAYS
ncbi:Glu/Leu/Phe/Val dehydrogenase [Chlamydia muridarum str. Nigg]|jgi:Glutamate dehydrogenase/leucine dehydrogenase|uniref:Leucine dehydrogenase n=2 Tax=Chlamydia muridarum TaxID=83560 RepID=A0A069ZUC2_CHLMR|nr:Glu/Leu/Phe/Val dehydrogenase [Chlamydia muridarum]AAF73534.1 Glu/Leu/Phe/Val dehydrogenase family protein [Chlamydia muridarum str. Nigg]AHH22547.1 leucine dehydrogenase [Chlamydia muridarum str. Nigg3 CMUT3-5]AHH23471.1 leucine dehydrogenase [Chlamydia muridarum str. Nigg CM972]AID37697.1 leucine dehydrogenase [Chlamydia muridarum str. Nigg 2 MCR]AIT90382.1 leucine dehydrogenase [Chlamydia muridarum]